MDRGGGAREGRSVFFREVGLTSPTLSPSMAQTAQKSFDVLLGVLAIGAWCYIGQRRRLLSLAAVLDGISRVDAARIGGMDRQTLRDWVHRFNQAGPDGLFDHWSTGRGSRLFDEQKAELAQIVETGPDPVVDGVVRWRRIDLQRVIKERFGVEYHEHHVGALLKKLGFSHSRHPVRAAEIRGACVCG